MTAASRSDSPPPEEERGFSRRALTARDVHDALRAEGVSELERPWNALAWSGLAAGISMGLSLVAEGAIRAYLPEAPWRTLVSSLGYPIGFLVVTLGRQQLFTETTLTACLPFLHDPSRALLRRVVRLWAVVLAANLLGALIFAATIAIPGTFGPELREAFAEIGHHAVGHPPASAFVRGVLGGWIIALMVWVLPSAGSARPWVVFVMTYVLAAAGLTHIIAGSAEVFYGIIASDITVATYLRHYGFPVLLGNSVGGIVLVALVNHAQVAAEVRLR